MQVHFAYFIERNPWDSNDSFQNPSIETTDLISTGETEISIVTETEEVAEGTVRAGTMMTEAAEIEPLTR